MKYADHIDQTMAIMAEAFDPAFGEAWTRRQVEDALFLGNCHLYLAAPSNDSQEGSNRAVGFSLSRTGYEEEELLLFAVLPQHRRNGIGLSILEALRSAARDRGAKRLLLEMRKGNPAEHLYNAFGFVVIGERKGYYRASSGDRVDAITFAYEISIP